MAASLAFVFVPFSFLLLLGPISGAPVHEILRINGLPKGILPKVVKSFALDSSGRLDVFLDHPCYVQLESRVFFDRIIAGNLSYGAFTGMAGVSQEELFLRLPVKDIRVEEPGTGVILFDIGVAKKQVSVSLFEDPIDCLPDDGAPALPPSGYLEMRGGRKGISEQR